MFSLNPITPITRQFFKGNQRKRKEKKKCKYKLPPPLLNFCCTWLHFVFSIPLLVPSTQKLLSREQKEREEKQKKKRKRKKKNISIKITTRPQPFSFLNRTHIHIKASLKRSSYHAILQPIRASSLLQKIVPLP
jgi:hypothetical protein